MENLKELENMVIKSDKANLERCLGSVVEAVLTADAGKSVNIEEKSQELVNVIDNIFDRELDKSVAKKITADTLNSIIASMVGAIQNGEYKDLESMLEDSCNIAYFKLAQKNEELKLRNVTMGALSATVAGLKPRYLERANAEFASLLKDTLEKVKSNVRIDLNNTDIEDIADVMNSILAQSYEEKYRDAVDSKYTELEDLEASEDVSLPEENNLTHVSKADRFVSELDNSLENVVCWNSSVFYDPKSFMVTKAVKCDDKLNEKINKSFTDLGIASLTLPKFVTLVKGTNLAPEELNAAQSWLSDKNVETYDIMANLVLGRK